MNESMLRLTEKNWNMDFKEVEHKQLVWKQDQELIQYSLFVQSISKIFDAISDEM